ncbi:MAG: DUF523 domain-containing protein [Clostridia bacterium]|nr:DUF523 domain-containing protein [Clostridia bacterium]
MESILVSACLLGTPCRYDGKSKANPDVLALSESYNLIPVCPEVAGGLPTPRVPSERIGDKVMMRDGRDVTDNYRCGAQEALRLCRLHNIKIAILKERSPSCGKGEIYDGSFSGVLTARDGVTAELLTKEGIRVIGESEINIL